MAAAAAAACSQGETWHRQKNGLPYMNTHMQQRRGRGVCVCVRASTGGQSGDVHVYAMVNERDEHVWCWRGLKKKTKKHRFFYESAADNFIFTFS